MIETREWGDTQSEVAIVVNKIIVARAKQKKNCEQESFPMWQWINGKSSVVKPRGDKRREKMSSFFCLERQWTKNFKMKPTLYI